MTTIEPLFNRVVIRPDTPVTEVGGVILPDGAQEQPSQGEIVAIGAEVETLRIGDRVLFAKYIGAEVEVNGEILLVVPEREVLGRLRTATVGTV